MKLPQWNCRDCVRGSTIWNGGNNRFYHYPKYDCFCTCVLVHERLNFVGTWCCSNAGFLTCGEQQRLQSCLCRVALDAYLCLTALQDMPLRRRRDESTGSLVSMACFFQWRICAGSNALLCCSTMSCCCWSAETDRLHFWPSSDPDGALLVFWYALVNQMSPIESTSLCYRPIITSCQKQHCWWALRGPRLWQNILNPTLVLPIFRFLFQLP